MEKLKGYSIAFLVFCVLSSKNIIIYNEETLVALSFLAFVFFVFHYYGNTIAESLNERGAALKLELQNLGLGRLDSLDQLYKQHQKLSTLNLGLSHINLFAIKELIGAVSRGGAFLYAVFTQQIEQKLTTIGFSKIVIQQKLQHYLADDILGLVHLHYQRSKGHNAGMPLNGQLINKVIQTASV